MNTPITHQTTVHDWGITLERDEVCNWHTESHRWCPQLTSVMGDDLSMGRFPVKPGDLHLTQLIYTCSTCKHRATHIQQMKIFGCIQAYWVQYPQHGTVLIWDHTDWIGNTYHYGPRWWYTSRVQVTLLELEYCVLTWPLFPLSVTDLSSSQQPN